MTAATSTNSPRVLTPTAENFPHEEQPLLG